MKRYTIPSVLFALSLFIIPGCTPQQDPDTAISAEDVEDEEVTTAVAGQILEPQLIRSYIAVSGEIQPVSTVDVFPETAGELIELSVEKGDRVNSGTVIGQVDPSRPGQRFSASPIRAPISGTIIAVTPRVGSQVSPQTTIARIATTSDLEILTMISERYISRITPGRSAEVFLDAFPDELFPARIAQISPVVDRQTRTLETTLRFNRADSRIRPGMFARVQIILEERPDALVVPQNAVMRRDGNIYVYVIDENNRARRREVTIGIEIDGNAELRSGVAAGEQVIIRGQNLLENGSLVRIVEGS
ncbi:MAG: efflux RND transporter periplasmic adaptor subunit [Spirochaeta sp.]